MVSLFFLYLFQDQNYRRVYGQKFKTFRRIMEGGDGYAGTVSGFYRDWSYGGNLRPYKYDLGGYESDVG